MNNIGYVIANVALIACLGLSLFQVSRYRDALKKAQQTQPGDTRYLAAFPENMVAINDLISRTTFHLVVVTDFCGYGHFSAPELFAVYEDSLISKKKNGVFVEVHLYDQTTTDTMTASQFDLGDPNQCDAAFAALKREPKFAAYFKYHGNSNPPLQVPVNVQEFVALMSAQQGKCVQRLQEGGVFVRNDVHSPLPVFMWIRDDEEAIFSMYNLGHHAREISLITRDRNLVLMLRSIAQNYAVQ
jgi:hypothetical protein